MSLKSYLEGLEIGETKAKLSAEEIKGILAESGKIVDTEKGKVKSDYETKITDYTNQINSLKEQLEKAPNSNEIEGLKKQIADFQTEKERKEAEEKSKHDDEILTQNIVASFGDKKFVNDFTKQAIVNEVKTALKDENNLGKSAKDIFEELTKDKDGIFANPNQVQDMPSMGDVPPENEVDKAKFNKMGYKARVELKNKNPKLYEELNKEE